MFSHQLNKSKCQKEKIYITSSRVTVKMKFTGMIAFIKIDIAKHVTEEEFIADHVNFLRFLRSQHVPSAFLAHTKTEALVHFNQQGKKKENQ